MPGSARHFYVLLLGERGDPQIQSVVRHIEAHEQGVPLIVDTAKIPGEIRAHWSVDQQSGCLETPEVSIPLTQVRNAYWRELRSPAEAQRTSIAEINIQSWLLTLMQVSPFPWVNNLNAYRLHQTKPVQIARVQSMGVATPETLITDDPNVARQFLQRQKRCILKPMWGGAHAELINADPAGLEHLAYQLSLMPCTLQQFIAGVDIRSYVFGDVVFSVRIEASTVDFRLDNQHAIQPWVLPEHIAERARRLTQALGMHWTAIDWRLDISGQYTFLEANFSPMFHGVETRTGLPLSATLAQLLCRQIRGK